MFVHYDILLGNPNTLFNLCENYREFIVIDAL